MKHHGTVANDVVEILIPVVISTLPSGWEFKINSKSCRKVVKIFELWHKITILFRQKYIMLQQHVENDISKVREW